MSEHTLVSEQTLTLLLRGEWICPIRYPDAYRFLADDSKRRDTESFLARLGRRLSCTRQGGAWFAAYIEIGPEERRAIREHFVVLKHDLRPLVDFFTLVMRAQRQDEFLAPGTVIASHALMAAIDGNLSLTTELKALAGYGKGTVREGTRSILNRLLRKLLDDGYLTLSNSPIQCATWAPKSRKHLRICGCSPTRASPVSGPWPKRCVRIPGTSAAPNGSVTF